ncbi:TetR/AcrR family transcriptional regulator [Ruania albidiflava]|uniref:TetR/AcrR family transcriptional regulator n=1 Tax=Ruania albidiflava TaxID=366586 RepID=UPI0003B650E6|nr:TetR family transcriptional regulator [Ruania albidiflava]
MPRSNPERRRALADAAIELLAAEGSHGLTHRAVERAAGVPAGTASNYFPSRQELFVAAAERAVALHEQQMQRIDDELDTSADDDPLVALVTASLVDAVTTSRRRYLALFELQSEATRQPALAVALAALAGDAQRFTAGEHARLGLTTSPDALRLLITLYGGALFALVNAPVAPGAAQVRQAAAAIVTGARSAVEMGS